VYLGGSLTSPASLQPVPPVAGQTYFPATGHNVDARFFAYWQANGGLAQFGYPLAEATTETFYTAQGMLNLRVQYFERARFEYHAENQAPYDILLGQFGRQILAEVDLLAGNPGFATVYTVNASVRGELGAPQGPALAVAGATQRFERGRMFFLGRGGAVPLLGQPNSEQWIYATCGDGPAGTWLPYADTWQEGQDPGGGAAPTAGRFYPRRGFGKVWREHQDVQDCLGLATAPAEQGLTITVQRFQRGLLLATPAEGTIYVLHYGTFQNSSAVTGSTTYERYPTPAR